jgi:hypothetical protein
MTSLIAAVSDVPRSSRLVSAGLHSLHQWILTDPGGKWDRGHQWFLAQCSLLPLFATYGVERPLLAPTRAELPCDRLLASTNTRLRPDPFRRSPETIPALYMPRMSGDVNVGDTEHCSRG